MIAFWVDGRSLIGKVVRVMRAGMDRRQVDPALTKCVGSIVAVLPNIALVLGILGDFEVPLHHRRVKVQRAHNEQGEHLRAKLRAR